MTRAVVACVALLALTGCGATHPSAAPTTTTEDEYVALVQMVIPNSPTSGYINLGHSICAALDRGSTPDQVAASMLKVGGITDAGIRVVIRAAVTTYCPKHEDIVPHS